MATRVDYICSDFDESAHKGMVRIDLQNADLADESVDVVLSPHVLEHVPNTQMALSEVYRFLVPGGHLYLQVPMTQGRTAPPSKPEYHGDNTPVFWRFGWDIGEQLRAAGFSVESLVTEDLKSRIARGDFDSGYRSDDCDEVDLLTHASAAELTPCASASESRIYGFLPDFHFITWEAIKPKG